MMKKNSRKIKLLMLILVIALSLKNYGQSKVFQSRGVPANPKATTEYLQPDGSRLTIHMNGDAVVNWATTIDGYTLLMNQNDGFEYAIKNADGDLMLSGILAQNPDLRTELTKSKLTNIQTGLIYSKKQVDQKKANHIFFASKGAPSKAFPTTGTRKLIMILANFNNTTTTYTQTQINNYMNQANYNSTGSFKDYFFEASYGLLTVNTTVTAWVTLPNTHDYYGPDTKWGEFAFDAVTAANATVDYSQYDNDGDGTVDGVAIIHQGVGQEASGSTNDIWSHSWDLTSAGYSAAQRTFDGVKVSSYTTQPEKDGASMATIGVMCHEFGHNLGAPDFYDTDYGTGGQYDGTGDWDLQAGGSYNGTVSGTKPAHPNAYTICYVYNWATPTVLSTGQAVTVSNSSAQNTNSFYRFNTTTSNEYYLIENRQATGFDAFLPGHGMIIYHVDGDYIVANDGAVNASSHQGMYPMSAVATTANGVALSSANKINVSGCPWPGTSSKTTFTDATTPNSKSWAGANTAKPITAITENTVAKTVSFNFMGGSSCTQPTTQVSNFSTSAITQNSMTVSWSRGNGNNVIVVARASSAVDTDPTSGTSYTANAAFGSGNQIGTGNFVVYNGNGGSVNLTGLTMGVTYHFALYEYNNTGVCYKFPALVGNATTLCNVVSTFPWNEGFENAGNIPACWTQEVTTPLWVFITGGAHGGTYNACLKDNTAASNRNKLITPQINFNGQTAATLTFWHTQVVWDSDQDELRIYYKTSAAGAWVLLDTYTTSVTTWTQRTIALPNLSNDYYIAFEGDAKYGYGVCLDDISISVSAGCTPPTTQATTFTSSSITSTTMTVGWTRGNGNNVLVLAKAGSAVNSDPVSGTTYTANAAFGSGTQIGTGNYVVYSGPATSVNLTALTASTTYHFAVYEYATTGVCYKTPGLIGNATTIASGCTPPTTQATTFTSSAITATTMTAGWTRGNGNNVLVVAKAGSAVNADPVSGTTYTANAAFGSGTQIGTGNYVVYSGPATSVNLTALSASTTYHFAVYEYATTGVCYKTPGLIGSASTLAGGCVAISTFPWTEGFENGGVRPNCWTEENVTGTLAWKFQSGGQSAQPASAHTGSYNAFFYEGTYGTSNVTKLITPSLVLGSYSTATLSFWYANADWSGDQDELKVYYKTSFAGSWNLISTYNTNVSAWTQITIPLTNISNDYYIAFEGKENYGYGVVIDDINVSVTSPAVAPVADFSGNPTTICSGGTIAYSDLSTNLPTSWLWNFTGGTPSTSTIQNPSVTYASAGSYNVSLTVANSYGSNTKTSTNYITVNALPTVNAGVDKTICNGNSTSLTATGGTSYTWNTGANTASITVSPTVNTTYTVTVANANGCTASDNAVVTVNVVPTASAGVDKTVCSGVSTTLTATGGTSYTWNTGANTSSINVSPLVNTTYTVTVTNAAGCSASDNTVVTVNALPTANAGDDYTVCNGVSTSLTATGGTGYTWNTGATTATITVTPVSTSTYTVTVANAAGCTAIDNAVVTVNILPAANAGVDKTLCDGVSVSLTATGGTDYTWNTGVTTATLTVTPAITTTYTVTVANATGCTASDNAVVTVNSLPIANAGLDQTICNGQSATFTASGGNSYSWNVGVNSVNLTVSPAVNTTYTVTVTNATGCSASDAVILNVDPLPTANAGIDYTVCNGLSASLTATGGVNYTWNTGSNNAEITVNPIANTTYTVTVENANGCTASDIAVVTVNELPIADAGSDQSICEGTSLSLTATGGSNYTWNTGSNNAEITVNPIVNSTYTVTVANANGCSASDFVVLTINAAPIANAGADVTICQGQNAIFVASGGNSYSWNNGNASALLEVYPIENTTYTVTVASSNGCTASDEAVVVVNALPTANAGIDQSICEGSSISLTAIGGISYTWNTGSNVAEITVSPIVNTTYTVSVSDANSCTNSDEVVIFVNQLPAKPSISYVGEQLISSAAIGNQWYLDGVLVVDSTNQYFTPLVNGNYTVIITDANGCVSEISDVFAVTTIGVHENRGNEYVLVYPNPNNGKFFIKFNSIIEKDVNIELVNAQGQIFFMEKDKKRNQDIRMIELANCPNGVYYLKIDYNNSFIIQKIIVN